MASIRRIPHKMTETLKVGVIGLGVMGQRMLARLATQKRLQAVTVWDPNPASVAAVVKAHPHLHAAADAEALIASPGLHSLYIATPPAAHMRLSELGFDAGLAVFCEKPLTVDFDAARRCIARIEKEGHRAAVNYALASSPGLSVLQTTFGAASHQPLGALREVQIELAFAAWPRQWQSAAGAWLAERQEGGFSREVLSHFVFVLQRVLGPARTCAHRVSYPPGGISAETAVRAELHVGDVPIRIDGRVGGGEQRPDHNRMLWRTDEGEVELTGWFGQIEQRRRDGMQVAGDPETVRNASQSDQLIQWAAMIEGRSHSLPGYAEALAVQETIEGMLKA
jgi:predicted dehydrogenase